MTRDSQGSTRRDAGRDEHGERAPEAGEGAERAVPCGFGASTAEEAEYLMHQMFAHHRKLTVRFDKRIPVRFGAHILATGPAHLTRITMSCELDLFASELGLYYAGAVRSGRLSMHQNGQDVVLSPHHDSPILLDPRAHTTILHGPPAEFCVLGIEPAVLESLLAEHLERPVKRLRCDNTTTAGTGKGLVPDRLMRLLEDEVTRPTGLLDPGPVADRLWETVMTSLLYGARHQYSEELRTPTARLSPRTLLRAITAMEADPAHPFTLDELARIANVGPRALQNAFRQHRGTTPLGYLRNLRLRAAHEELLSAEPPATVSEIAARWGFAHPGRFATLYQQHYHRPPSRTLYQGGR
ncbi:AraC family transcriptional regulator [Streptomyces sp. NPDC004111]|uniref:AraC family transcriptional regulator n=1 Tax=Streptomyces sp. NPDC004111 TaxID=3364690 RepID=UPI00368F1A7E